MKIKKNYLKNNLDQIFALFGVITALIILFFGIISQKIVSLFIGFMLFISCIFWIKIRNNSCIIYNISASKKKFYSCTFFFFILYIISLLLINLRNNLYERPFLYFIFTSLMAGIVACEILTSNHNQKKIILLQIFLYGVFLAWSQLSITPGLVGQDPWYHMYFTDIVLHNGYLPLNHGYSSQPIFHLLIIITSLLTTLQYKFASLLSVTFCQILCNAIFIYLIGSRIFKNYKIGLLSSFVLIISPDHIRMSYWAIPNGFAIIYLIIILFLIIFFRPKNSIYGKNLLLFVIMLALIIAHPLVAICTAIILFVIMNSQIIYNILNNTNLKIIRFEIIGGFSIIMLSWWAYASYNLKTLANFINSNFSFSKGEISMNTSNYSLIEILLPFIGLYIIITVSFIGFFYMISKRGNYQSFLIAIVSIVPLFIIFISYIIQSEIIAGRWTYIALIFMSIAFGCSIYIFCVGKGGIPIRSYGLIFCAFSILSFLIFISPSGNLDYPIFNGQISIPSYFTQSEIKAVNFINNYSNQLISTDTYFGKNALYYNNNFPSQLINYQLESEIYSGNIKKNYQMKVLRNRLIEDRYRKGIISKDTFLLFMEGNFESYINKIYNSNVISSYL